MPVFGTVNQERLLISWSLSSNKRNETNDTVSLIVIILLLSRIPPPPPSPPNLHPIHQLHQLNQSSSIISQHHKPCLSSIGGRGGVMLLRLREGVHQIQVSL